MQTKGGIIRRVAAQANAYLPEEEKTDVSPHVLRHTFLRKLVETKGVHYAREASGPHSDRYCWRYVKPDQQTLADAVDELEQAYKLHGVSSGKYHCPAYRTRPQTLQSSLKQLKYKIHTSP